MSKVIEKMKQYNVIKWGGYIYGSKKSGKEVMNSTLKVRLSHKRGNLILELDDEKYKIERVE